MTEKSIGMGLEIGSQFHSPEKMQNFDDEPEHFDAP